MMDIKNELRDVLDTQRAIKKVKKQQKWLSHEADFEKILKNILRFIKEGNENNISFSHILFKICNAKYTINFFYNDDWMGEIMDHAERCWLSDEFMEYLEDKYAEFFTVTPLNEKGDNNGIRLDLK